MIYDLLNLLVFIWLRCETALAPKERVRDNMLTKYPARKKSFLVHFDSVGELTFGLHRCCITLLTITFSQRSSLSVGNSLNNSAVSFNVEPNKTLVSKVYPTLLKPSYVIL